MSLDINNIQGNSISNKFINLAAWRLYDLFKKQDESFPYGYCNIASRRLVNFLKRHNYNAELAYTFLSKGEGHTFVKVGNIIIDPTYSQIDPSYDKPFIGDKFPIEILNRNITEPAEYHALQTQWNKEGLYD